MGQMKQIQSQNQSRQISGNTFTVVKVCHHKRYNFSLRAHHLEILCNSCFRRIALECYDEIEKYLSYLKKFI